MLTLSIILALLLVWARHEWRLVKAHEAEMATVRRELDKLAGLTREAMACEVCHQVTPWLVPVVLYDAIEWACPACSDLMAAKEVA